MPHLSSPTTATTTLPQPGPTQLSSAKKALLAIGIGALIAGAIQAVRFHSDIHVADDVRHVLDADIPAESTRIQIESYLDSAHIAYMYAAGTHFQDQPSSLIALAKGASRVTCCRLLTMKCKFGSDLMTRNISSTTTCERVPTALTGDKSPVHSLTRSAFPPADGTDTQLTGSFPRFGACTEGNCTRLVPKVTVQLLHSCVFQTCNGISFPKEQPC